MNGGPDESVRPGECPLCRDPVSHPTTTVGIIPILAAHFASACAATEFTPSVRRRSTASAPTSRVA